MKNRFFIPTFCAISSTRTDEMLSADNTGTKLKRRKGIIMSEYKLKTPKLVEQAVVGTYKKIEDGVVDVYKKIEERFVDAFLEKVEPPEPPQK